MSKPNENTVESHSNAIAQVRAKLQQFRGELVTEDGNAKARQERLLGSLETASPADLIAAIARHQATQAALALVPENTNHQENRAAESYVSTQCKLMATAARSDLSEAASPLPTVRKFLLELATSLTQRGAEMLGLDREKTLAERDDAEQKQAYLTSLIQSAEHAIAHFEQNPNVENWGSICGKIGQVRHELAAAAQA